MGQPFCGRARKHDYVGVILGNYYYCTLKQSGCFGWYDTNFMTTDAEEHNLCTNMLFLPLELVLDP